MLLALFVHQYLQLTIILMKQPYFLMRTSSTYIVAPFKSIQAQAKKLNVCFE